MIFMAATALLITVIYGWLFFAPAVHKLGKKILERGGQSAPALVQDPLLYVALPAILNLNSKAREIAATIDSGRPLAQARTRGAIFLILFLVSGLLIGFTLAVPGKV